MAAVSEAEEFEFRRRAEAEATPAAPVHQERSLLGAIGEGVSKLPSHVVQAWHGLTVDAPDAAIGLLTDPAKRAAAALASQKATQDFKDTVGGYVQQVRNLSPPASRGDAPEMNTAPAQAMEAQTAQKYGINPAPARLAKALQGDLGQPNLNGYRTLKDEIAEHPLSTAMNAAPFVGGPLAKTAEGVAEAAGPRIAQAMERLKVPDAPSIDSLRGQAGKLYETAKQQGVVVKPNTYQDFARKIRSDLESEGLDPDLQPKATAVLNRISGVGNEPIDLTTLDNLRKLSTNATAATAGNASDKRLTRMITDSIDSFVGDLKPADVLSGDPEAASSMLGQARGLWKQQAKGQVLEDLIAKAKLSSAGTTNYDGALRSQFQKLARNQRGMAQFTPDEQVAILKVASGNGFDQAMFQLGKMAPTSAHVAVPQAALEAVGYSAGHPVLAAAPALVGVPAKIVSTMNTSRNAKMASALARNGR